MTCQHLLQLPTDELSDAAFRLANLRSLAVLLPTPNAFSLDVAIHACNSGIGIM
jgi:hypothetical protein